MKRMNVGSQLIMAKHNEKGIWYFTSSIKLCEYCGISYGSYYLTVKGATKQCKGWTFSIVEDNESINKGLIDPKTTKTN